MENDELMEAVQVQLDRLNLLMPLVAGFSVELYRTSFCVYSRQFNGDDDMFVESDYRLWKALRPAGITREEWGGLGVTLYKSNKDREKFLETAAAVADKLADYLLTRVEDSDGL